MSDASEAPVFRYKCRSCDEWHMGIPTLACDAPDAYLALAEADRASRCTLESDVCVIDEEYFFIRGNIHVPVHGLDDEFSWGVWCSISCDNFNDYMSVYESDSRTEHGPYFGWLSVTLSIYPDTINLKTNLHLQSPGFRPSIELEPTDHPLAREQREGMSQARLTEICAYYL